jgi:hypothetical protein
MMNGSDLLARRVDMNSNALSYPLKYFQQTTFRTTVDGTSSLDAQINLTGLRSGSLKSIDLWACALDDFNGGNPNRWVPLGNVRLLINGLVYYDAPGAGNQFWSLVDRKTSATAAVTTFDASGSSILKNTSATNIFWVNIPFAQHTECLAGDTVVATGVPVMNSILNLNVTVPSAAKYVISASYNYASNILFSKGKSCPCDA